MVVLKIKFRMDEEGSLKERLSYMLEDDCLFLKDNKNVLLDYEDDSIIWTFDAPKEIIELIKNVLTIITSYDYYQSQGGLEIQEE